MLIDGRYSFHVTGAEVRLLCHDCGDLMLVFAGNATQLRKSHPNDCWRDENVAKRREQRSAGQWMSPRAFYHDLPSTDATPPQADPGGLY